MSFHEFTNMIEVETPQGWGHAIFIQDVDHDYHWTVVLAESRAIVTFKQSQIRVCRTYTNGWDFTDAELGEIIRKPDGPR